MATIGISCFYHDAAAACVSASGDVLAAVQEERFSRQRHDSSFPTQALQYCVQQAQQAGEVVEHVVFYENPLLKFDRIVETTQNFAPDSKPEFEDAMSKWLGGHLFQVSDLKNEIIKSLPAFDVETRLHFIEHHSSHAASAFYPSPFENAAILTLDGVGEHATVSIAKGERNQIFVSKELHYPNSLGLLYSAFTHFTGFKINSGEYKMMGLAPYGEPVYEQIIRDNLVSIDPDGLFHINQDYFAGFTRNDLTAEKLAQLFDLPVRAPDDPLTKAYADMAASIQRVTEDIVLRLAKASQEEMGCADLCLAGGVALNSVANGKVAREIGAEHLWIQPAAGDAGGALGAAFYGHHVIQGKKRLVKRATDAMQGAYLGPSFSAAEIETRLASMGAVYTRIADHALCGTVAEHLADGKSVAWFQGRMEYGPRALGNRSILGDPRSRSIQRRLNLQVKKRESFRPFAPVVLEESAAAWFELEGKSPYMLLVAPVREQHRLLEAQQVTADIAPQTGHSRIPAVTHVDFSARVQSVNAQDNPLFHELLREFEARTGCPILVNTSFNVRGEPIVCTPEDAFRCFVNTELDFLVVGPFLIERTAQDPLVTMQFFQTFEPD